MDRDDLEPIDLEPIDLQPVDRGSGDEARFDRDRPRNPRHRRAWLSVAVAGLAAWAAIALTSSGGTRHTAPSSPTTVAPAVTLPHVDLITTLAPRLWAGLRRIGFGRFAVVVGDRLYLLDDASTEAQATLVPLPEGHVIIDEYNGSSLLATTFQETLVSTTSTDTRTLLASDVALRSVEPARWWLLSSDGTIRADDNTDVRREPRGLRVAAAVHAGFVAIDPANARWVLWSGATVARLEPSAYELVGTGTDAVVFRRTCTIYSCVLVIDDPTEHSTAARFIPAVPQFAEFSPDQTRLAVAGTLGQVFIIDARTGATLSQTQTLSSADRSLPFTWTTDSRFLLVVQDHGIEVRRASDGAVAAAIPGTDGVQQVVALP